MSLKAAFDYMLGLKSTSATIRRRGSPPITGTVKLADSNYFRNLAAPDDIAIRGREFVMGAEIPTGFVRIERGDVIDHPTYGTLIIAHVTEMAGLGSEVIGHRIRTE